VKTAHTQVALGVLIIGLLCRAAWAQSPQPASDATVTTLREEDKPWNRGMTRATQDVAEAQFLEGNRLFRVPLFAQAAAKYTAALRTWQHPAFYFNLALAQLNLGQDVAARDNLERALGYGDDPLGAAQFQEGQRQLRELETQLGKIRIICQTPGAVVTLDGVTLFTAPGSREAWVMPKTHEVAARKREYLSESRQVTVRSGKRETIELKLITLEEAADANRRWATWKPWAVVGAGVAIAGGGGVFHALSARNMSRYDEEYLRLGCANDEAMLGCGEGQIPAELSDQRTRARHQQIIAVGSYVAGGAVVATGVVMLYLNRPRLDEQRAPTLSGRRIAVLPTVSNDMLGLVVSVGP
jgi:tetratricopeptide (TPR) repeat protein